MPKFILASSSPRRLQLLNQIGYKPDKVYDPDIDETPIKGELPSKLALRLAESKALKAHSVFPNDIVLAADTLAARGRRILNKPLSKEEAKAFLELLSGHRHRVYTAITVIYKEKKISNLSLSIVKFKRLTPEEINFYCDSGEWRGRSGGFTIQGLGNIFIEWIKGSDTSIVGLNLNQTYKILSSLGLKPDLNNIAK